MSVADVYVRCAKCGRLCQRETAKRVAGYLYGPCCYVAVLNTPMWRCSQCKMPKAEADMQEFDLCKVCARRLLEAGGSD